MDFSWEDFIETLMLMLEKVGQESQIVMDEVR